MPVVLVCYITGFAFMSAIVLQFLNENVLRKWYFLSLMLQIKREKLLLPCSKKWQSYNKIKVNLCNKWQTNISLDMQKKS